MSRKNVVYVVEDITDDPLKFFNYTKVDADIPFGIHSSDDATAYRKYFATRSAADLKKICHDEGIALGYDPIYVARRLVVNPQKKHQGTLGKIYQDTRSIRYDAQVIPALFISLDLGEVIETNKRWYLEGNAERMKLLWPDIETW